MRTLWLITLISLTTSAGQAQSDPVTDEFAKPGPERSGTLMLSVDPVFNKVLSRRVSYPIAAIRSSTYGRIYAGFDIDAKGRLQNVTILSPEDTGVGFEYEVRAALKRMPPLNPRYVGHYALPVSFELTNWGEGIAPEPHIPDNKVASEYLANRLLLGEVIFRASIRHTSIYIPPSRQIVYY